MRKETKDQEKYVFRGMEARDRKTARFSIYAMKFKELIRRKEGEKK